MLASVFAALHLGAQSMSSLLVPTDVDETVLGGFSRDRYESSRVCASASLWAPETLESKNASLKAGLNIGDWSLSIGGTGRIQIENLIGFKENSVAEFWASAMRELRCAETLLLNTHSRKGSWESPYAMRARQSTMAAEAANCP